MNHDNSSDDSETSPLLADNDNVHKKRKPTPLPKVQIALLMLMYLTEPMTSHCIYPFINQLISDMDIAGGDKKKVGYYAGLIESIFYATQAMFVFQWARLSDHIGRKPVLLIGFSGICISMLSFGLSRTFWALVVSRSLVGMLNGNAGVMKSMMGELTDETNIAQGVAFIPVTWAAGTTIGPMVGGQLATPHDRWPHLFSHPFWVKYPYFLPCGVVAAYAAFCFLITTLFLNETLQKRRQTRADEPHSDTQTPSPADAPPPLRMILTRRVVLSVANYGAVALSDIAIVALFPLFLATPVALGGLGLPPQTIGLIMGSLGLLNGAVQALVLAKLMNRWGPKRILQAGLATFPAMHALFPVMSVCAKAYGLGAVVWALVAVQMLLMIGMSMSFGAIFMFVRSSVPDGRQLGAVNGLAQFTASACRTFGPALATSLFATALERNWLGGYAAYLILALIAVALSTLSTLLPPRMWPKSAE